MAAMAGILNHQLTAGQALLGKGAAQLDDSTGGTSGTGGTNGTNSATDASGDSATISANDFLTLLVTEMQNQDPTADTDPNEYINQLVSVNSLEQLIDINQTLSSTVGTPTTGATSPGGQVVSAASGAAGSSPAAQSAQAHSAHPVHPAMHKPGTQAAALNSATAGALAAQPSARRAPGNLAIPTANPAAHRVAQALGNRSHAPSAPGAPPPSGRQSGS